MLTFTVAARDRVLAFMHDYYAEAAALRVAIAAGSSPVAPDYEISLVEADDAEPDDVVVDTGDFKVFVDGASASRLEGAVVDFVSGGFEVRNPNVEAGADGAAAGGDLGERVARVIEERINPAIAAHGGRITLIDVQDGIVHVRMSGGCQGCGMAAVTLRQGVERMIREAIPEVVGVRDVTDHASGRTPFYSSR